MGTARRAKCTRHDLVAGDDGRCVLCRRGDEEAAPPPTNAGRVAPLLGLLGVALAGGALVVARLSRPAPVAAIPALPTAETKIAREAPTLRPSLPPVRPADAQSTETIPPAPGGAASGDDEASLRQRILDRARADTARAARRNVSITMYSTSWCPVCAKARSWLNGQGLAYSDLDVEKDDAAKRRARELNARGSVPTIDIDGEVLVGFSPEHAAQLVDRAAARRAGPP